MITLTPQEKEEIKRQTGFDATNFDFDDASGEFVPAAVKVQPSANQTPAPKDRDFFAFGTQAAKSVLPTAVSLLAPLAIPGVGWGVTAARIGAGLIGGLGSSVLQEKALNAVAPTLNADINQAAADNPISAMGGRIAGGLTMLRSDMGKNLTAAGDLIKGMTAGREAVAGTEAAKQMGMAGVNAAIGGGIGTGVELAQGASVGDALKMGGVEGALSGLIQGQVRTPVRNVMSKIPGMGANVPSAYPDVDLSKQAVQLPGDLEAKARITPNALTPEQRTIAQEAGWNQLVNRFEQVNPGLSETLNRYKADFLSSGIIPSTTPDGLAQFNKYITEKLTPVKMDNEAIKALTAEQQAQQNAELQASRNYDDLVTQDANRQMKDAEVVAKFEAEEAKKQQKIADYNAKQEQLRRDADYEKRKQTNQWWQDQLSEKDQALAKTAAKEQEFAFNESQRLAQEQEASYVAQYKQQLDDYKAQRKIEQDTLKQKQLDEKILATYEKEQQRLLDKENARKAKLEQADRDARYKLEAETNKRWQKIKSDQELELARQTKREQDLAAVEDLAQQKLAVKESDARIKEDLTAKALAHRDRLAALEEKRKLLVDQSPEDAKRIKAAIDQHKLQGYEKKLVQEADAQARKKQREFEGLLKQDEPMPEQPAVKSTPVKSEDLITAGLRNAPAPEPVTLPAGAAELSRQVVERKGGSQFVAPLEEGRGQFSQRSGTIGLDPTKADLQTATHEASHATWQSLTQNKAPHVQMFVKQMDRMARNDPAYKDNLAKYGNESVAIHETLANKVQGALADVATGKNDINSFKGVAKGLISKVKQKLGIHNDSDLVNVYISKMLRDRPAEAGSLGFKETGDLLKSRGLPQKDVTPESVRANLEIKDPLAPKKESKISTVVSKAEDGEWYGPIRSLTDSIRIQLGAPGRMFADALTSVGARIRELNGQYTNKVIRSIKSLSADERKQLFSVLYAERAAQEDYSGQLTGKASSAYREIRDLLVKYQEEKIANRQPVVEEDGTPRLPEIDPFYFPHVPRQEVISELLNHPNSSLSRQYVNDFIDHQIKFNPKLQKMTPEQANSAALAMFHNFVDSFSSSTSMSGDRPSGYWFGPNRKAEGIGLPEKWIETNVEKALDRYFRKANKDRAWFEHVESNNALSWALGQNKDPWGNVIKLTPEEHDVIGGNRISGNDSVSRLFRIMSGRSSLGVVGSAIDGMQRVANASVMSAFLTGLRDLAGAVTLPLKYGTSFGQGISAISKGLMHINEGRAAALEQGSIKLNLSDYQESLTNAGTFAESMDTWANRIFKYTGRQAMEEFTRSVTQSIAKELVIANKVNANTSSAAGKTSQRLMKGLAGAEDYKALSNDELAARLLEYTQGTYDYRGLPGFVMDSQISPFLKLSRWSIEQGRNFTRDVVNPAIQHGDYAPFARTLVASVGGGLLATKIGEFINGMRSNAPQLEDLEKSPRADAKDYSYWMANILSQSSQLGIYGDLIRGTFDALYKNNQNLFASPALDYTQAIARNSVWLAEALARDPKNAPQIAQQYLKDTFVMKVQMLRLANRWLMEEQKDVDTKDAKRNIRIFNMINDYKYSPLGGNEPKENPYLKLDAKGWRDASTVEEVQQEMPKLQEAYASGDIDKVKSFQSKTPSTIPSPDNKLEQKHLMEYLSYYKDRFGQEELDKLVSNYSQAKAITSAKNALVP